MKLNKKMFLIVTLLVSLFVSVFMMNSINKVNAKEVIGDVESEEISNDVLLVAQRSDGTYRETLANLSLMLETYGSNGKLAIVSSDYDESNCTFIANISDLIERFGIDGQMIITGGESDVQFGNLGGITTMADDNRKKIVFTDEDLEDPYIVGICSIGQLYSLS